MAKLCCGLDFGTSNSSVAVAGPQAGSLHLGGTNGGVARILDLDPTNDAATSLPSLLYITREGESIVGRAAANAFIDRNIDREVLLELVDLGISIEGYVGSEPDKSEGYRPPDLGDSVKATEGVRACALVETNSPGRLFQSLKSLLRHKGFRGTEVFGRNFQIEELTAQILTRIKEAVDRDAGTPVESVVMGRPVHFSKDSEEDAVAERRLHTAAQLAGFKDITFFYEPVAACVEYAISRDHRQRLMVVDIGGGTCDVCVMEFGGAAGTVERLAESKILGVSGIPVAGDMIDREIIRERLFPYFGSRSRYGPSRLPVPQYLFSNILDWQNIYKLNTEETINWLIAMEMSSDQPKAIQALRCLIQRNYGYPVAREVEMAKKRLSFDQETVIALHKDAIQINERLERNEFSHIIEHILDTMMACIEEAESAAQIAPHEVDHVLTTGGTSLIPAIRERLEHRYGADRIIQRDTFTSVAAGLAVVAQYA